MNYFALAFGADWVQYKARGAPFSCSKQASHNAAEGRSAGLRKGEIVHNRLYTALDYLGAPLSIHRAPLFAVPAREERPSFLPPSRAARHDL
jgi:hypothetical protein